MYKKIKNNGLNQQYKILRKHFIYGLLVLILSGNKVLIKSTDFFDGPFQAAQFEYQKTKDSDGNVPKYILEKTLKNLQMYDMTSAAIAGINWEERGPDNFAGRTRAIYIDRNDTSGKTVWAGGVSGGLWKTTDISMANPIWNPKDDFFNNLAVTDISADKIHPDTFFFCTGEGYYNSDAVRGGGVWETKNGGLSFTRIANTTGAAFNYCYKILHIGVDTILVGTRQGLQQTLNGGISWTQIYTGPIIDIEYGGGIIHISRSNMFTAGIYAFSDDFGVTWNNTAANHNFAAIAGACKRFELALSPTKSNIIYAVTQHTSNQKADKILISTNKGITWRLKNLPTDADPAITTDFTRGQAWYDLTMKVDPADPKRVFIGGIDLFISSDSCNAWTQITHWYGGFGFQNVHADQHTIEFDPFDNNKVYFGNDGGIYRATNANATTPTILNRNKNYNITQFYSADAHPTNANYFLAGAQDNGSHKFTTSGINSTTRVTSGDGAFVHIDQNQPTYQFTSYVYNNFRRSTNDWTSFTNINQGNTGRFINPSDYDDVNNIMYSAEDANYYLRWDNPQTGNTFNRINVTAFNSRKLSAVTVSPNTNNRVFFGTDQGRVIRVDNAHTATPTISWINNGSGLPTNYISCIAVEKGNDNHILVTYSSYNTNSVWETTNGGTTWTSVEGNLPNMPVRWAVFSPYGGDSAFLATELGVWSTTNLNGTTTNWGATNTGLANVRTDMIKVRLSDTTLIAATHGRGLYTSTLATLLPVNWVTAMLKNNEKSFEISWKTTNEINASHYEIWYQKISPNSSTVMAYAASINAKGNKYGINQYEQIFIPKLGNGRYLVYLKQYDDNRKLMSTKKFLGTIGKASTNLEYSIYNNKLRLKNNLKNIHYNVKIMDLSGKIILNKEADNQSIILDIPKNRIYILKISTHSQSIILDKIFF